MSKIACDVVKDIMPLCIDDVCSENSKQLVNEHIIECDKCKKLWDSYSNASITNEIKDDNDIMFQELTSQIKKKNRRKTIYTLIGGAFICIFILAIIMFTLLGLFSLGRESYLTVDINNYGIYEGHVKAEKADLNSGLFIFPKEISENARDIDFLYSCESIGFGTSYQQFLKCTYPEDEYRAEIDRLKNVQCEINTKNETVVNHVEYSESKFIYPAYIAAYGGLRIYEYALCNESTRTITYIYLQKILNDEVAFSKEYLPIDYQDGKELLDESNMDNKNIYVVPIGNGAYQDFRD